MKTRLARYRLIIYAGFALLALLLAVMVTNLLSQLRSLSLAASDNIQWSIAQLDTEFANLNSTLTDQIAAHTYSSDEIQLRIDIALSRLDIINSGRAVAIFGGNETATGLIAPINAFAQATIALSDKPGALNDADLREIQHMLRDILPDVRNISILGVRLSAEKSEERRAEFARQLSWTGGADIGLLILMAGLLLVLDRLLARAEHRDSELLRSSKLLEATIAASLDPIITADHDERIIGMNEAAEQVFGWSRDEINGKTINEAFIPPRLREAHQNGMKRYAETGEHHVIDAGRVELSALRKSGEEIPVEVSITTTEVADRRTFIVYMRDISEQKINEQKMVDARDRAQRTDQAKSHFLAVMSHEIRTPLNGILGVLDLLKTTDLTAKQERYANIATASGEVLLEYVNEALDITRIETGELKLTTQDFDLATLMNDLIDVLDPLAREKSLKLTVDIDENMRMRYRGDSNRVRQILTNLIGNAIKFTDRGSVSVLVGGIHGTETSSLRIAIRDTGDGIAPDNQEQIFEDYVALGSSKGRQNRSDGLGLSISRRISREMGGDIHLESAVGEGATFTLSLPLLRSGRQAADDLQTPRNLPTRQSPKSILVVEDNNINRRVLRDMLEGMGHLVKEVTNGQDCLEMAEQRRFDLIFMDINMPKMDGIEATRRLRSMQGPNSETRIVGLTAHGKEEYREAAHDAGMNRFHTKPIRMEALQRVLSDANETGLVPSPMGRTERTLLELCSVLSVDRVETTGNQFFSELAEFATEAQAAHEFSDLSAFAEMAHRLKGAAALLGMDQLEAWLDQIEMALRANLATQAADRASRLQDLSDDAKSILSHCLEQTRKMDVTTLQRPM